MDKKNIIIILLCILTLVFGVVFLIDYKNIDKEDNPPVTLTNKYYNTLTYLEFDKYSLDNLIKEYSAYSDDDDRWAVFDKVWQEYKLKCASTINKALTSKESFILFYYEESEEKNFLEEFVDRYKTENNIYIFKVDENIYKETSLNNYVTSPPSVIIIKEGKIYSFTDINDEKDKILYESYEEFKNWLDGYINKKI